MTTVKPSLAAKLRSEDRRQQPSRAPGSGGDKKLVNFRLEPEVVYQLKLVALQEGKPLQSLLCEGVNEVLTKRNLPAIAK